MGVPKGALKAQDPTWLRMQHCPMVLGHLDHPGSAKESPGPYVVLGINQGHCIKQVLKTCPRVPRQAVLRLSVQMAAHTRQLNAEA